VAGFIACISNYSNYYLAFEPPQSDQWSCMKTTHDRILDLPMKKAKQSRPTREEILEGIGYTPLTFPASLHVPEALRAKEERASQDYVVGAGFLGLHPGARKRPGPERQAGPGRLRWPPTGRTSPCESISLSRSAQPDLAAGDKVPSGVLHSWAMRPLGHAQPAANSSANSLYRSRRSAGSFEEMLRACLLSADATDGCMRWCCSA
jgi:hypothetical protein